MREFLRRRFSRLELRTLGGVAVLTGIGILATAAITENADIAFIVGGIVAVAGIAMIAMNSGPDTTAADRNTWSEEEERFGLALSHFSAVFSRFYDGFRREHQGQLPEDWGGLFSIAAWPKWPPGDEATDGQPMDPHSKAAREFVQTIDFKHRPGEVTHTTRFKDGRFTMKRMMKRWGERLIEDPVNEDFVRYFDGQLAQNHAVPMKAILYCERPIYGSFDRAGRGPGTRALMELSRRLARVAPTGLPPSGDDAVLPSGSRDGA